jgi:NAD(P)-dependent dehydrogenase (short-subunit alcohol dehydrogenase family)
MTPEYRARRLGELPLRRFGGVEDVAYCAAFLAADEAGYLTGQILHPSGGGSWGEPSRGLTNEHLVVVKDRAGLCR